VPLTLSSTTSFFAGGLLKKQKFYIWTRLISKFISFVAGAFCVLPRNLCFPQG
jgi:hypothetical protein